MSVYTFWGNKNESRDGTSVLKLQSGSLRIGHSANFTSAEYNYYSQSHVLKPGSVLWDRNDFPWEIDDPRPPSGLIPAYAWKSAVNTFSDLPPFGNNLNDTYLTRDTFTLYEWDGRSWQVVVSFMVVDVVSDSDSFDRADGAIGSGWVAISDGGLRIASNQVRGTNVAPVSSGAIRIAETYGDDQSSRVDIGISPIAGDWIGPAIRMQNNGQNCYVAAYFNNGGNYEIDLYKRISGVYTRIGSTVHVGQLISSTQIRVRADGKEIIVEQNDVVVIDVIDSSIGSGGLPGIISNGVSATVDNWLGTSTSTTSGGGIGGSSTVDVSTFASNPPAVFTHTSTDANGVEAWKITASNDSGNHFARVVRPTSPVAGVAHNILFLLPVEVDWGSTYGDGINYIRGLGLHNQYNLTLVELAFGPQTWYADNPNDPFHHYDSFISRDLAPWALSTFLISGSEEIWLIGFSRSGLGCLDLLFRHPDVFARGAAWDFPGVDMVNYTDYGADNFGSQDNFTANYQLSSAFIDSLKTPFLSRNRIWISGYQAFQRDLNDTHALFASKGVIHTFGPMSIMTHAWGSGWVPAAIADLSANSNSFSDDFDRANGSLGTNWTAWPVPVQILSHKVAGTTNDFCGATRTAETYPNDQFSQVEVTSDALPANAFFGPVIRGSTNGANHYLGIYWNNTSTSKYELHLYKRIAGTYTEFAGTVVQLTAPLAAGSRLRLSANGGTIAFSVNEVDRITVADGSLSSGSPGVLVWGSSSFTDNWEGGQYVSSGSGGGGGAITFTPTHTDSFNRADSSSLGTGWLDGFEGSLHILSNLAIGVSSAQCGSIYSAVILPDDHYSQVVVSAIALPSGSWIGPTVRTQNGARDCYLVIYYNNGGSYELDLYKRISSSFTQIGSGYSLGSGLAAGTKITLQAVGNSIAVYVDSNPVISVVDASIPNGGAPGIMSWSGANVDAWGGDNASGAAPTSVPSSSIAPVASGGTFVTGTLMCSSGSWTQAPTSYSYHWQTDASGSFVNISGATTNSYAPVSGDIGHNLRCQVTATNSIGLSTPVSSNSLGPITAAPPTYSDNFNRANGSLGTNWIDFTTGGLAIVSNAVKGTDANNSNTTGDYRTETYSSDHSSQISIAINPPASDWMGAAVRISSGGSNCYLMIYYNTGSNYEIDLYKRIGGTFTQLTNHSLGTTPLTAGDTLKLQASGTSLTVSLNGTAIITHSDSDLSGGVPGIMASGISTAIDNWVGGG